MRAARSRLRPVRDAVVERSFQKSRNVMCADSRDVYDSATADRIPARRRSTMPSTPSLRRALVSWCLLAASAALLPGCTSSDPKSPEEGRPSRDGTVARGELESADRYLDSDLPQRALPLYDRVLSGFGLTDLDEAQARIGRARAKIATGDAAGAIADLKLANLRLRSGKRADPARVALLSGIYEIAYGDAALHTSDARTAREHYLRAEAITPGPKDPDGLRARIYITSRLLRESDAESRRAAITQPMRADLVALADRFDVSLATEKAPVPVASKESPFSIRELSPVRRSYWGARTPTASGLEPMTKVYRITVHHTGEKTTATSQPDVAKVIRDIQAAHMNGEHYADIGYHLLIDASGRIWEGRDLRYQGAHAGNGALNEGNIGVCLLGNFDVQSLPLVQAKALTRVLDVLTAKYGVKHSNIYGHGEIRKRGGLAGTECPGDRVQAVVTRYRQGPTP